MAKTAPPVPAFFGSKATAPKVTPAPKVGTVKPAPKKEVAAAPPPMPTFGKALYTFPLYANSVRPAGLLSWVGTNHCVVRKDRLMQTPKGYDALKPHPQEQNAELRIKNMLATGFTRFD